ncbi:MAG: YopX family protein [Lachnospiraceae bacterium]
MRKFIFKAWDKIDKVMHTNLPHRNVGMDNLSQVLKSPKKYEVMQCVGFSDKNKVEMYEGDIVQRYLEIQEKMIIGVIVWCDLGFTGFYLKVETDDDINFYPIGRGQYDDDDGDICNDEIIGNIFETPELLRYTN